MAARGHGGVGGIEGTEVHLAHADAQPCSDDGPQQFAVLARVEFRSWQLIPTIHGLLFFEHLRSQMAHLPDEIVGGYSATLYVPFGSLNAYKAAEGWKEFANIVEE